ncbi:hypothetical protein Mic7113_3824 [Allocoleopsis franciscana PCC 7113]|uniref:Uncharacterized protein n=1 Tax=Allocoleopsis franciscana PCC 7113 TaxID=1173027 RepID=K9WIB0_9CYAN|nr:hypothetical protein Mic7113_3824 [Allocoleopsis franciscana PCC 7113]
MLQQIYKEEFSTADVSPSRNATKDEVISHSSKYGMHLALLLKKLVNV